MGAACVTCGKATENGSAVCLACQAAAGPPPPVHLAPDAGIQTYADPYPAMHAGHTGRRTYLPGRQVLAVTARRGDWVQVTVEGADVGWVDGRQLVPPATGAPGYVPGTTAYTPVAVAPPPPVVRVVTVDLFAGVLASAGIVLGASLSWTQFGSVSSFSIPVQFLFDPETTARNPRLGWFLLLFGILGLLVTFVHAARQWRIVLGLLSAVAAIVYMGQVAAKLPAELDFTDAVGAGVWITLISGVALMISAALVPHERL
jgi:hypothetical protein